MEEEEVKDSDQKSYFSSKSTRGGIKAIKEYIKPKKFVDDCDYDARLRPSDRFQYWKDAMFEAKGDQNPSITEKQGGRLFPRLIISTIKFVVGDLWDYFYIYSFILWILIEMAVIDKWIGNVSFLTPVFTSYNATTTLLPLVLMFVSQLIPVIGTLIALTFYHSATHFVAGDSRSFSRWSVSAVLVAQYISSECTSSMKLSLLRYMPKLRVSPQRSASSLLSRWSAPKIYSSNITSIESQVKEVIQKQQDANKLFLSSQTEITINGVVDKRVISEGPKEVERETDERDIADLGVGYLTRLRIAEDEARDRARIQAEEERTRVEADVRNWTEWRCLVCGESNRRPSQPPCTHSLVEGASGFYYKRSYVKIIADKGVPRCQKCLTAAGYAPPLSTAHLFTVSFPSAALPFANAEVGIAAETLQESQLPAIISDTKQRPSATQDAARTGDDLSQLPIPINGCDEGIAAAISGNIISDHHLVTIRRVPHHNPYRVFENYPAVPRVHGGLSVRLVGQLGRWLDSGRYLLFGIHNSVHAGVEMNDWRLRKYAQARLPAVPCDESLPRFRSFPRARREVDLENAACQFVEGEFVECRFQKVGWTRAQIIIARKGAVYDIRYVTGEEYQYLREKDLRLPVEKRSYAYHVELCLVFLLITQPLLLIAALTVTPALLCLGLLLVAVFLLALRTLSVVRLYRRHPQSGLIPILRLHSIFILPLLFLFLTGLLGLSGLPWMYVAALFVLTMVSSLPVLYMMRVTWAAIFAVVGLQTSAAIFLMATYIEAASSLFSMHAVPLLTTAITVLVVRSQLHKLWDVQLNIRPQSRFGD